MRLTRVYSPEPLSSGTRVQLGVDSARHLITVLRLKSGDELVLFNGKGGEFIARITTASKQLVEVEVGGHLAADRESPLALTLAIGISRGERMDYVIQKATELGVSAIVPLLTERTEVRLKGDRTDKKQRHWQQVIISACEQCGRNRLPDLSAPQPLARWLSAEPGAVSAKRFVLHHRADNALKQLAGTDCTEVTLLVGPEGGLSDQEIKAALAAGFSPLRLGPRILRTETAPLAAISVLQALWGDWN